MIVLTALTALTGIAAFVLGVCGANGKFEGPDEFAMFGLTCFLYGMFVVLAFALLVSA